jgi:hypothetical protein
MNLEILKILEKVYASKYLRRTMVPCFMSSPGQGKSKTIEAFAKDKGKKMVKITLSQRMPNEVIGMLMPDLQNNEMVSLDSKDLLSLKDGDILFFDEMFNGTLKQTLDAVLNFLEDRILMSGRSLADVMIVAASNPEGMIPLTPQIKERVVLYNIAFKAVDFTQYLIDKYYMPDNIATNLSSIVHKESFSDINKWNYNSARSVEKAINAIGRGVPHPNETVFKATLAVSIELPIDLPEIDKVKGDKIPYIDLLTEILKINEKTD